MQSASSILTTSHSSRFYRDCPRRSRNPYYAGRTRLDIYFLHAFKPVCLFTSFPMAHGGKALCLGPGLDRQNRLTTWSKEREETIGVGLKMQSNEVSQKGLGRPFCGNAESHVTGNTVSPVQNTLPRKTSKILLMEKEFSHSKLTLGPY